MTVAVMVTSLPAGTYVCVMIVSIGVIQPGALCMRKPSRATPMGCVAWSLTVRPAAAVALSPLAGTGARNFTLGPVAMRIAMRTVSVSAVGVAASDRMPVTYSESAVVSIGVTTFRYREMVVSRRPGLKLPVAGAVSEK